MHIEPDWGIIITAFSIALSVVSLFLAIKFPADERDLTLATWKDGIRRSPGEADKKFLRLIFLNTGREVLYEKDFVKNVTITLPDATVSLVEVDSSCNYNQVRATINGDTVVIAFNFLEKSKYLKVTLFYDKAVPTANFAFKIIGGPDTKEIIETNALWHRYYYEEREGRTILFVRPLFTISAFLIQFHTLRYMFGLETNEVVAALLRFGSISYFIILTLVPVVFISILIGKSAGRMWMPFAVGAWKEANWYRKEVFLIE